MNTLNTDLLPPLFDQIIQHYGGEAAGTYTRANIIKALENGIINAAAENEREAAKEPRRPDRKKSETTVQLKTSDRLSGEHLSRAALNEQLQKALSLNSFVIELAVLLIEAQIDLRLQAANGFKLSGIEFVFENQNERHQNIAKWCQDVLQLSLQGARNRPTVLDDIRKRPPEGVRLLVESLQVSATLRDAVPYMINVDRHLVEPLLVESPPDRIRLLHISDLHLVEDSIDPQRGKSPTFGQLKHSVEAASLLSLTIDFLRPPFNLLVATGDLSTDGTRGSLETVLQYIQSGPITGENKRRLAIYGLNAGRRQRLLLPGNHDRFKGKFLPRQRLSYLFEELLGPPPGENEEYPYVRGFRPAGQTDKDLTLLFFVFDSTLPYPHKRDFDATDTIAKGIIAGAEVKKMIDEANDIEQKGKVTDLNGATITFDKTNVVRVALLHHHPVVTWEAEEEERRSKQLTWTR